MNTLNYETCLVTDQDYEDSGLTTEGVQKARKVEPLVRELLVALSDLNLNTSPHALVSFVMHCVNGVGLSREALVHWRRHDDMHTFPDVVQEHPDGPTTDSSSLPLTVYLTMQIGQKVKPITEAGLMLANECADGYCVLTNACVFRGVGEILEVRTVVFDYEDLGEVQIPHYKIQCDAGVGWGSGVVPVSFSQEKP